MTDIVADKKVRITPIKVPRSHVLVVSGLDQGLNFMALAKHLSTLLAGGASVLYDDNKQKIIRVQSADAEKIAVFLVNARLVAHKNITIDKL